MLSPCIPSCCIEQLHPSCAVILRLLQERELAAEYERKRQREKRETEARAIEESRTYEKKLKEWERQERWGCCALSHAFCGL